MFAFYFQVFGIPSDDSFVTTTTNREEIDDDASWGELTAATPGTPGRGVS